MDKAVETEAVGTAEYLALLEAEEAQFRAQADRLREETSRLRAQADLHALCSDIERWIALLRAQGIGEPEEQALSIRIRDKHYNLWSEHYSHRPWRPQSPTTSDNS